MMKKIINFIADYLNSLPILDETIINVEPDIMKCRIAEITQEQYNVIQGRWDDLDMMDTPVPVFWHIGEDNVRRFYWNNDYINFETDLYVLQELDKLGIRYG